MSSRSLTAARARRAGEQAPPVSGNRPVTSIGSQAAFAQQPPHPNNVRLAKLGAQNPYNQKQPHQPQQQPQQPSNNLPFTKLSISDAIGLITLRLGRVEQYIIDKENEEQSDNNGIPENSKIIDTSVLNNIINRIDSLERKEPTSTSSSNNEQVSKNSEELSKLSEQLKRLGDEFVKNNLTLAKHSEQLFKFERELVETKDILKTFMIKYDGFVKESNDKFNDYEFAISEIEKSIQIPVLDSTELPLAEEELVIDTIISDNIDESSEPPKFSKIDLKNMIKQELTNS
jgi:hypothetical protein